jgi:hypothetical protein
MNALSFCSASPAVSLGAWQPLSINKVSCLWQGGRVAARHERLNIK